MKYITCIKPGEFRLEQKPSPIPKVGEALLRIHRVGICGTDLHAYAGNQAFFTYPRILGHELAAEVMEVSVNDRNVKKGDKVVMPYMNCGKCLACRKGKTNCCSNIKVLGVHIDGGMQQEITVNTALLIPTNNLSWEQMAVVEPLAIGVHAIKRANVVKGETAVVVGCGPIGIGLIKFLQLVGARVIALDNNEDRLRYAKNEMGADAIANVSHDPVKAVADFTNGDFADIVFDATGNKNALETGTDFMAHGGRYVLVGLSKGDLIFNHPKIHAKETSLLCSRNATFDDFRDVIENIHEFPVSSFITHHSSIDQMISDFDSWLKPETGVIKAMVTWSEDGT